jgi:hypothetical protein
MASKIVREQQRQPVVYLPHSNLAKQFNTFLTFADIKSYIMSELVKQIVEKTGIPAEQAQQVLGVVAGFVKQKFPQFGGQIDSLLGTSGEGSDNNSGGNILGDLGSKLGF